VELLKILSRFVLNKKKDEGLGNAGLEEEAAYIDKLYQRHLSS